MQGMADRYTEQKQVEGIYQGRLDEMSRVNEVVTGFEHVDESLLFRCPMCDDICSPPVDGDLDNEECPDCVDEILFNLETPNYFS